MQEEYMICNYCGYENSTDAEYCTVCGHALGRKKKKKDRRWIPAICIVLIGIVSGILLLGSRSPDATASDGGSEDNSVSISAPNEICQVLPMADGSVAAVYTDGTVKVSGNPDFSDAVRDWRHVSRLYYTGNMYMSGTLFGLTEDGSVLATDGSLSDWHNVKELYFPWQGVVGVCQDGRVLAEGDWEDPSFLTSLTNVDTLVYSSIQDIWGCLKKDGTVSFHGEYMDPYVTQWSHVQELRDSGHAFYVIGEDGTVASGMGTDAPGLKNAVKVVDYNDWIFGISADGSLLTPNGGNIYTNTGEMMVDAPGAIYYTGEVDIRQFDQVADIIPFYGLILLNKDGTVASIGDYPNWDLSDWSGIQMVCGATDPNWENYTLYGIKQDGSVITCRYNRERNMQTQTDHYKGWKLQNLYTNGGGVVGLTVDGTLVGDGIYENLDFSALDP